MSCVICLEDSNDFIKCDLCASGIICDGCYEELVKHGKHEKCPVCCQPDWNEKNNGYVGINFSPYRIEFSPYSDDYYMVQATGHSRPPHNIVYSTCCSFTVVSLLVVLIIMHYSR